MARPSRWPTSWHSGTEGASRRRRVHLRLRRSARDSCPRGSENLFGPRNKDADSSASSGASPVPPSPRMGSHQSARLPIHVVFGSDRLTGSRGVGFRGPRTVPRQAVGGGYPARRCTTPTAIVVPRPLAASRRCALPLHSEVTFCVRLSSVRSGAAWDDALVDGRLN